MVAILIAAGFLAASLQTMVVATVFRVKAQEKQVASQLIQEEIENLNSIAINLPSTTSNCLATSYSNGYAQALWNAYNLSTSYQATPNKQLINNEEGKRLGLRRINQSASSIVPHKVLRIRYEVREFDGTDFAGDLDDPNDPNIIATDYIEVMPNAAFQCP
ncbi:hypothetical protein IQ238_28560 [Pleurocapsales cyanobacterium LEGE 06147]|nr:hypothetical protein [Pleurocapsales cyanobacterium LEGE 06147]